MSVAPHIQFPKDGGLLVAVGRFASVVEDENNSSVLSFLSRTDVLNVQLDIDALLQVSVRRSLVVQSRTMLELLARRVILGMSARLFIKN